MTHDPALDPLVLVAPGVWLRRRFLALDALHDLARPEVPDLDATRAAILGALDALYSGGQS